MANKIISLGKNAIYIKDFDQYGYSTDIKTFIYSFSEERIGNLISKFCKMYAINKEDYVFILNGHKIDKEPNKTLS